MRSTPFLSSLQPALRVIFPLYVVAIIVGSVIPEGPDLPINGDKVVHFGAYAVMALLGLPLTTQWSARGGMFLFILAIGAGIELVQTLLPYRMGSVWDMAANAAGAVIGAAVWLGLRRFRAAIMRLAA